MEDLPFNPDKALRYLDLDDDSEEDDLPSLRSSCPAPTEYASQRGMFSVGSMDTFGVGGDVVLAHVAPLWVRVVCIRMLLLALDIELLDRRMLPRVASAFGPVGVGNVLKFCQHQGVDSLPAALEPLLAQWDADLRAAKPAREHIACLGLRENLEKLVHLAQLDEIDEDLLLFFVLADQDLAMTGLQRRLGDLPLSLVHLLLAHGLGQPVEVVQRALSETGRLAKTHLLKLDLSIGRAAIGCHYDLPSRGFSVAMGQSRGPVEHIAVPLATIASEGELQESHFRHLSDELTWMQTYLDSDPLRSSRGTHILLYGQPGVGKSQLARLIARQVGRTLIEIRASDNSLMPCDRASRLRGYQVAQALYGGDVLFLLDECEDLLSTDMGFLVLDRRSTGLGKAWLIDLLESSRSTIWICNDIDEVDPAVLRRFQFCLQLTMPPERQRHDHIKSIAQDTLHPAAIWRLARHPHLSPAVTQSAIQTVAAVGHRLDVRQRSAMALSLVNQQLCATGQKEIRAEPNYLTLFDPSCVNSDPGIEALLAGLAQHRDARLLLYGPPGTGKTLFGKFLAQLMDCEAHQHKTSELLSKYVGEAEQRISRAFARARTAGAILHFDEVDSVLMDRQHALQNHEVTLVNTFLEELESHTGIVVATTNRMQTIDPAALRRFDVLVKLDYMKVKAAVEMFRHMCSVNGTDEPSDRQLDQVSALDCLTPGDFEQVRRQARFLPLKGTQDLVDRLTQAVRSKRGSGGDGIGFLRTA